MKHLLPLLFVFLLSSCQMHGLRLDEEEVKSKSLEGLLKAEGLDEEKTKEEMGKSGESLLHHAAEKGWVSVVHKLLLQGVAVDSTDKYGWTPLHRAAEKGHTAVAQLLLEKGARVDSKDNSDWTPLHRAALWGHPALVQLLLEKGADLTIQNRMGRTALQEAELWNQIETASCAFLKLAEEKAKEWLEGYSKGYSDKKTREKDEEELQAYAKAYAGAYEEAGTYEKAVDRGQDMEGKLFVLATIQSSVNG